MSKITKTLNPLHFEDLEPHRFEDLVRQVIYDFRQWHSLEATGRLGADEGVDIRGFEQILSSTEPGPNDEEDELALARLEMREWRVQCKRERRIGPTKLNGIVDDLLKPEGDTPYGVLVVASCDFSKKSRDIFRVRLLEAGVEEFFLWGKAELEDRLFMPQHDHLLWAYFGISIRIRRRSMKSQVSNRLTTKKRLVKALGEVDRYPEVQTVLIRDPEAEDYPWPGDADEFRRAPRWRYYDFEGHVAPDLLGFVTKAQYAWLDEGLGSFDVIEGVDSSWPRHPRLEGIDWGEPEEEENARRYWTIYVPEENQAMLREISVVHYDQILAVDAIGDIVHEPPHLVVDYEGRRAPFRRSKVFVTRSGFHGRVQVPVEELVRQRFFPLNLPRITSEEWRAYFEKGTPG